jgi:hypothetical protein
VRQFLSRLMGAFIGEGKASPRVAAGRLAICRTNRCGTFDKKSEVCMKSRGGCGCHMPTKVTYASVKLPGQPSVKVSCPKGLW